MFLEAKQNRLHQQPQPQQLPNGHATLIGSGCSATTNVNSPNFDHRYESRNGGNGPQHQKIPPRPPIRSTTTTTTVSIAGGGVSSSTIPEETSIVMCGAQLNNVSNSLSNESPNVKFVLTHKQQQQHSKQPIPQAAMNEMRV